MCNFNVYEFEQYLKDLKISGKFLGTKRNYFNTSYCVKFDNGVTFNRVKARKIDLGMFLGCELDVVASDGYIELKANNNTRDIIYLNDFMSDYPYQDQNKIPIAIGQDENGKNVYCNLRDMRHLLVAGSTGSGKSVFLQNAILSVLKSNIAEIYLIDPKKVEFSFYKGVGGALRDVITDTNRIFNFLGNLVNFMDNRYNDMSLCGVREFSEYRKIKPNENAIVVIVDEFADLMLQSDKKKVNQIEEYLIRIAQLGRACGISLILATQSPRVDVVTGLIKANFPSRLAFTVSGSNESRIILDRTGAEKLRGNGDGLFSPMGVEPIRIQAPYISDNSLIEFLNYYKNLVNKDK